MAETMTAIEARPKRVLGLLMVSITLAMIITAAVLALLNEYTFGLIDFLIPVFTAACISGLIIHHHPDNLNGWFIAGFAFLFSFGEFSRQYALFGVLSHPGALPYARAMAVNAYWAWYPGIICLTVLIPLHFPTGRLLDKRWRIVVWLGLLIAAAHVVFATTQPGDWETPGIPNPLGNAAIHEAFLDSPYLMITYVLWAGVTLISAASLIIRYRQASLMERKQIKWFTLALMTLAIFTLVDIMVNINLPTWIFTVILQAVWVILAISILWYRLFDIDLIIRRTLVYSLLTGLLGGVYFGGVALLQGILTADRGQQTTVSGQAMYSSQPSAVIIVVTTLTIAALFNPLRKRLQETIDHRFYRQKYDAEKALAEFAAAARNETDLILLSDHLTSVVQETLQPELVGLWLKPNQKRGGIQPAYPELHHSID